ncbi:hypothetical protein A3Q56_04863 [Intoshia linei]|uniref:carbonic anhydrase n=1 Tax=Intoshia linei TaxID=1819745 RepID=A0A177B199_9BILA|nr:hypothetical protein A3Q56_04863 [Intoshia linei]
MGYVNGLTIFGVLIDEDDSVSENEKWTKNLHYINKQNAVGTNISFNLRHLFPNKTNDKYPYFTYIGSLTTAPFTEHIQWVVFKDTIKLKKNQSRTPNRFVRSSKIKKDAEKMFHKGCNKNENNFINSCSFCERSIKLSDNFFLNHKNNTESTQIVCKHSHKFKERIKFKIKPITVPIKINQVIVEDHTHLFLKWINLNFFNIPISTIRVYVVHKEDSIKQDNLFKLKNPHQAIRSRNEELEYLRKVALILINHCTQYEIINCELTIIFLRDLLSKGILLQAMDELAKPKNIFVFMFSLYDTWDEKSPNISVCHTKFLSNFIRNSKNSIDIAPIFEDTMLLLSFKSYMRSEGSVNFVNLLLEINKYMKNNKINAPFDKEKYNKLIRKYANEISSLNLPDSHQVKSNIAIEPLLSRKFPKFKQYNFEFLNYDSTEGSSSSDDFVVKIVDLYGDNIDISNWIATIYHIKSTKNVVENINYAAFNYVYIIRITKDKNAVSYINRHLGEFYTLCKMLDILYGKNVSKLIKKKSMMFKDELIYLTEKIGELKKFLMTIVPMFENSKILHLFLSNDKMYFNENGNLMNSFIIFVYNYSNLEIRNLNNKLSFRKQDYVTSLLYSYRKYVKIIGDEKKCITSFDESEKKFDEILKTTLYKNNMASSKILKKKVQMMGSSTNVFVRGPNANYTNNFINILYLVSTFSKFGIKCLNLIKLLFHGAIECYGQYYIEKYVKPQLINSLPSGIIQIQDAIFSDDNERRPKRDIIVNKDEKIDNIAESIINDLPCFTGLFVNYNDVKKTLKEAIYLFENALLNKQLANVSDLPQG